MQRFMVFTLRDKDMLRDQFQLRVLHSIDENERHKLKFHVTNTHVSVRHNCIFALGEFCVEQTEINYSNTLYSYVFEKLNSKSKVKCFMWNLECRTIGGGLC